MGDDAYYDRGTVELPPQNGVRMTGFLKQNRPILFSYFFARFSLYAKLSGCLSGGISIFFRKSVFGRNLSSSSYRSVRQTKAENQAGLPFFVYKRRNPATPRNSSAVGRGTDNHDYVVVVEITTTGPFGSHPRVSGIAFPMFLTYFPLF